MAYRFLIIALLIFTFSAQAETVAKITVYRGSSTNLGNDPETRDTTDKACSRACNAQYGGAWSDTPGCFGTTGGRCNNSSGQLLNGPGYTTATICPTGSTDNGAGACNYATSCVAPQVRQSDGSCAVGCTGGADSNTGTSFAYTGVSSSTICSGGCTYNFRPQSEFTLAGGSVHTAGIVGTNVGTVCTTNATAVPASEKTCIDQGKSFITVGGVTTCLGTGANGATPVKTTTTSTTQSGTGSTTTTTKTTTITNGTATTITTTQVGTATPTTQTDTQPANQFCQNNPADPACKAPESKFAGACGGFTCQGDGIQCAIALRVYNNNCDAATEKTGLEAKSIYAEGQKIANGQDSDLMTQYKNRTGDALIRNVDVANDLVETGDSFASSGLTDLTFTAQGRTVTLPLSRWNQFLEWCGYILLALAYLQAIKIIGGGAK